VDAALSLRTPALCAYHVVISRVEAIANAFQDFDISADCVGTSHLASTDLCKELIIVRCSEDRAIPLLDADYGFGREQLSAAQRSRLDYS
jgi:hypothetical protein